MRETERYPIAPFFESLSNLLDPHRFVERFVLPYANQNKREMRAFHESPENRVFIELARETLLQEWEKWSLRYESVPDQSFLFDYLSTDEGIYQLLRTALALFIYQQNPALSEERTYTSFPAERLSRETPLGEGLTFVYRGQSNIDWPLCPSVVRELGQSMVLDDNAFLQLTIDCGMDKKYNDVMRARRMTDAYRKYAFFQHACGYSPMIDFTYDRVSAVSFALSNPSSFNCFGKETSAIFEVRLDQSARIIKDPIKARDFLKNEFFLYAIDEGGLRFGHTYRLKKYPYKSGHSSVSLPFTTIPGIVSFLRPSFTFIDCPANDRMVYQQGLFLVFYGCACFKTKIAYDLNPAFSAKPSPILPSAKKGMLQDIYVNHREKDPEHLMNPYLLFNE